MMSFRFFLYFFIAGAFIFFILNDRIISRVTPPNLEELRETEEPPFSSLLNATDSSVVQKQCIPPRLDPWDLSIRNFFNSHKNPISNCSPTFYQRSYIDSDGVLRVKDPIDKMIPNENCLYRCLYAVSDKDLKLGDWTTINRPLGAIPKCDVFDVQCNLNGNVTYKFLHVQIFEDQDAAKQAPIDAPDVHMIVLDSVSMSQFLRSMPLTTHYLRSDMDAIFFPYLNKVGLNSRPNAYGFLLGERAEAMPPNPWGKENPHGRSSEICQNALEKENFIAFDYQKAGYKTMMNEDMAIGIFNWPNCTGFTRNPVDHFMKPFTLRFDDKKSFSDSELGKNLYSRSCMERQDHVLAVLQEFTTKYPNHPKFSLSWISTIAHDDASGLYHVDHQFKKFFAQNNKKLANSYLILMGDHGSRYGPARQTLVGEIEDSNPFFIMTVPQKLRGKTDIMRQLYRNSKELITHFDLYATFLEIANKASTWTPETKVSKVLQYEHPNRTLLGSSLFHTLKQPRSCDSLMIPFMYCMCHHSFTVVHEPAITLKIAEKTVDTINKAVADSVYSSKCAKLTVDEEYTLKARLKEFDPKANRRIFQLTVRVKPSGAIYDVLAEYEDNTVYLVSKRFPRQNAYRSQTKCIPENFIRNYCYCKDLLKKKIRR